MRPRRVLAVFATAAIAALPVAATPAGAAVAASCSNLGISAKVSVWKDVSVPALGWLENLGFDGHGGMWVSELLMNRLVRFDASANAGTSLQITDPGASVLGSDGEMYVVYGDSTTAMLGLSTGGVVRFDPTATSPVATPFVSGLKMPNGEAFDDTGNLYVADTTAGTVDAFSPTGDPEPAFAGKAGAVGGADGVAFADGTLYVSELTDAEASIVQIPTANPAAHSTLVQLSAGGVPLKLPDDMAIGPDGALYVATATGQLIRVDRSTGAACVLAAPGLPLTSVRFPIGFPPYQPATDAFVTSEAGVIYHVALTGLRVLSAQPTPAATRHPGAKPKPKPKPSGKRSRKRRLKPSGKPKTKHATQTYRRVEHPHASRA